MLKNVSIKANSFINVKKTQSNKDISDGLTEALKIYLNHVIIHHKKMVFIKMIILKFHFQVKINKVKKAYLNIGLDKLVSDFEYSMNQTAELASIEASEIIVKAVIRFNDAFQILEQFRKFSNTPFKRQIFYNLYTIFSPIVKNEMNNTGVQKMLDLILKRYNTIPLVKKVNFDLTDYIT